MTRIGGGCLSMVRTCTGEVCVRSNRREPSGFWREIKRVVHFPRRMAFREIQLGEVVIVGLDVGTFRHREAHVGKDGGEFVDDLADRMHAAGFGRRLAHRQRDVDGLGGKPRIERGGAEFVFAAAIAAPILSLSPLIAGPFSLRSSGVIAPSVFRSADTEPLLPSAETRNASSAASSLAEETAVSSSVSSFAMSDIDTPCTVIVR